MRRQFSMRTMTNMTEVSIFEDDWMYREALVAVLNKEADLEVVSAAADVSGVRHSGTVVGR